MKKDDFDFKIRLFRKYLGRFTPEELKKRLNLKDWEYEYARRKSGICAGDQG